MEELDWSISPEHIQHIWDAAMDLYIWPCSIGTSHKANTLFLKKEVKLLWSNLFAKTYLSCLLNHDSWFLEGSCDYLEVLWRKKMNPLTSSELKLQLQVQLISKTMKITCTVCLVLQQDTSTMTCCCVCTNWLKWFAYQAKRLKTFMCALYSILSHNQLDWLLLFSWKLHFSKFSFSTLLGIHKCKNTTWKLQVGSDRFLRNDGNTNTTLMDVFLKSNVTETFTQLKNRQWLLEKNSTVKNKSHVRITFHFEYWPCAWVLLCEATLDL